MVFHCDVFLVALPNVFWQPALYPVIPSSLWLWLHSTGRLPGQWWPVNKMTRMKPCWSCGVVISEAMPQQWHCRGGGRRLCLIYVRWNCTFNLFVYSRIWKQETFNWNYFSSDIFTKKIKMPSFMQKPSPFQSKLPKLTFCQLPARKWDALKMFITAEIIMVWHGHSTCLFGFMRHCHWRELVKIGILSLISLS